jgi:uncharacterized protein
MSRTWMQRLAWLKPRAGVVPKMPIPGVGWVAYFKDTEGHIFGAMQADATAKFNG